MLVLFTIVAVVVYFAGAIVCLVGLLVSIPVVLIATAFMYKRIGRRACRPLSGSPGQPTQTAARLEIAVPRRGSRTTCWS